MATDLENAKIRRSAIYAELAALGPTKAGGLPNTSGANSIDEVGYKDGLYRELRDLNELIGQLDSFAIMTEADT